MFSERKYPSGAPPKKKIKQEVLKRASKMPKLTDFFGPLTSSFFLIQMVVVCCLCCQYCLISVNKCHSAYTSTWVAETLKLYAYFDPEAP
jgi:hypothetical protein